MAEDDEIEPRPHDGWPWRDFGGARMTHQRALAESVYAVALASAMARGREADFDQQMSAVLRETSEPYRRRVGDWAE